MRPLFLFAGFYIATFLSSVVAQTQPIPEKDNFTVDILSTDIPFDWKTNGSLPQTKEQGGSDTPIRIVSGRQGDTLYRRLEFKDGTAEEVWRFDSWIGRKDRTGYLALIDASNPSEDGPFREYFLAALPPGLQWLKPDCLVQYPNHGSNGEINYYAKQGDTVSAVLRAWVDSASGLPKVAQQNRTAFVYHFHQTAFPIPDLPPELAERHKARTKVDAFIKVMRERRPSL